MDFSPSLLEGSNQMFVKFPERASSWSTYIQPFDPFLWLFLLLLMLIFSLLLFVTYHFGQEKIINQGSFTFSNSLLTVLRAQMGQGSSVEPISFSTRVVFLLVFFVAIFVITCFSAKMIVFLSFFKLNHEIKTIGDILRTDYKIGTIHSAISNMFATANEGTLFRSIYEEKMKEDPSSFVDSTEEGLQKAKTEKYAFIWYDQSIYALIKEKCEIYAIPSVVNAEMIGIVWAKNLPHGSFFEHFIKKLDESALADKMVRQYLLKPNSDCATSGEFSSMGFTNTISAFAMLLLALGLAISIAVGECIFKKFIEKELRRKRSNKSTEDQVDWFKYA